jgi:maltose O-acetyltransferase
VGTTPLDLLRSALRPDAKRRSAAHVLSTFLVNDVARSEIVPVGWRVELLRRLGMRVGDGVVVKSQCWFGGTQVTIGAGSYVSPGCFFDTTGGITIGERVAVGSQVMFITGNHRAGPRGVLGRMLDDVPQPITIGDDVAIGNRAIIMAGVTIADGCVIGAGAMVNRDTLPDGIYVGSPARRVKDLTDDDIGRLPGSGLPPR